MAMFSIELHPHGEFISDYIRKFGTWDPIPTTILEELYKAVTHDTLFVDVGANIGYYSLHAASLNIPVLAFEPVAANMALFNKSIEINGFKNKIHTHMIPLSDKNEHITINICRSNMGIASTRALPKLNHSYSQTTLANTFDEHFGVNCALNLIVKIDVEEQETKVLRGMVNTLSSGRITHIMLEIARHDPEIFQILRKYGYLYVTNVGYGDSIEKSVTYLDKPIHRSTLDEFEKDMKQTSTDLRRQILIYRTPTPIHPAHSHHLSTRGSSSNSEPTTYREYKDPNPLREVWKQLLLDR
jgi:FkbM family methyltransferase